MNDKNIISRETLNGTKWQIIPDKLGAALYMNNYCKSGYHFSGFYFLSVEEAIAHLNAIDEGFLAPETEIAAVPADYYGVPGRYYGD